MDIRDPLSLVTAQRAQRIALHAGLPMPHSVELVRPPLRQAHYRVCFPDGTPDHELRVERLSPGHDTLASEAAAIVHLQLQDEVPTLPSLTVLPAALFDAPAAIHPWIEGVTGMERVLRDDDGQAVYRDVGRLLRALADVPMSGFGLRADGHQFVPEGHSWAGALCARAGRNHRAALAVGADLGPMSTQVLAFLDDRRGALEAVEQHTLVHGHLSPLNLRYRDAELAAVLYWPSAMAGDPLYEWAHQLFLPPDELGLVVEGHGGAPAQDAQIARIEAYLAVVCLERLAAHPDMLSLLRPSDASAFRETTADAMALLCTPGWVAARLGGTARAPRSVATRAVLRFAARTLVRTPPLPRAATPWPLAALAAVLLGDGLPAHQQGAMTAGMRALEGLGPAPDPSALAEPIADLDAWWTQLARDTLAPLAMSDRPKGCLSLTVLWIVLQTHTRLGPSAWAVLRGGEALIVSLREGEAWSADSAPAPSVVLTHATLGLAALASLQDLMPHLDVAPVRARLEVWLAEAWERADPLAPDTEVHTFDVEAVTDRLLDGAEGFRDAALVRPLLALAFRTLHGTATLPAAPVRLAPRLSL
jgi:hypothetical protein